MTKFFYCLIVCLALFACSNNEGKGIIESEEKTNKSIPQANFIDDFLSLSSDLFSDDYCYNKSDIEQLIKGSPQEFGWDYFEADTNNNFLHIENSECYSTITFVSFVRNDKKVAFLSQMSKNGGVFNYLEFDVELESWKIKNGLPTIKGADFFENLSSEEKALVDEYGAFGYYIVDQGKRVECLFYDWQMALELNYVQEEGFDKEADFTIEILWNDEKFWTKKNQIE